MVWQIIWPNLIRSDVNKLRFGSDWITYSIQSDDILCILDKLWSDQVKSYRVWLTEKRKLNPTIKGVTLTRHSTTLTPHTHTQSKPSPSWLTHAQHSPNRQTHTEIADGGTPNADGTAAHTLASNHRQHNRVKPSHRESATCRRNLLQLDRCCRLLHWPPHSFERDYFFMVYYYWIFYPRIISSCRVPMMFFQTRLIRKSIAFIWTQFCPHLIECIRTYICMILRLENCHGSM